MMNDYCVREKTATVNCEPKTATIKEKLQDAKSTLAELLVMISDTKVQLFGDESTPKAGVLEAGCLDADVNIVIEQARIAAAMMNEIRRRLV